MSPKEIRHTRIIELRSMALRGATLEELKARATQMRVSKPTIRSYLHEIVESIQRKHISSISQ